MNTQANPAKFAFYYLLNLAALIMTALAAGTAIFQIINRKIADPLSIASGAYDPGSIKFAISALIIAAPIYFVTAWLIERSLQGGELEKDSAIRRWLSYLVLLVSSLVMIGWLIATIMSFFDGDLTLRFGLKAVTALGIAAAIFTFHFYNVRRIDIAATTGIIRTWFYAALAFILASFVASLFFVESPSATRGRNTDLAVIEDFNNLTYNIQNYYALYKKLPADLEALKKEYANLSPDTLKHPISGQPYGYEAKNATTYALCTDFLTDNRLNENSPYDWTRDQWPHDKGRQCIEQRITPPLEGKDVPVPVK